jgi:hypothetical protein
VTLTCGFVFHAQQWSLSISVSPSCDGAGTCPQQLQRAREERQNGWYWRPRRRSGALQASGLVWRPAARLDRSRNEPDPSHWPLRWPGRRHSLAPSSGRSHFSFRTRRSRSSTTGVARVVGRGRLNWSPGTPYRGSMRQDRRRRLRSSGVGRSAAMNCAGEGRLGLRSSGQSRRHAQARPQEEPYLCESDRTLAQVY